MQERNTMWNRIWAMPSRWTFTIKPIRELLEKEVIGNLCDPFAGRNSPANITNDIDEKAISTHHQDALDFLRSQPDDTFDGVLFDPPYSATQAKRLYDTLGLRFTADMGRPEYWSKCKTEVARIIKPNGKSICFGWNSNGLGKSRGFDIENIYLIAHGSQRNDTIITVERKIL